MKGILYFYIIIVFCHSAIAKNFNELIKELDNHDLIQARLDKVNSIQQKSRQLGSWGDPEFSISALNFPENSFRHDESMMTGVQFGLSQKISVSGKYENLRKSGQERSKSYLKKTKHLKRKFIKTLWLLSIEKERLNEEKMVLKENFIWVENNLKVTKRLYSTGKVPQQAVLDIQIRKSELFTQIKQRYFASKSLKHQVTALLGSKEILDIDLSTIPWKYLDGWESASDKDDFQKEALKHNFNANQLKVLAQNNNLIPDITFGINYIKRNSLDGVGDFVSAQIIIPLPISDSRYAAKMEALYKKAEAKKKYQNYINTKPSQLKKIKLEVQDLETQLGIIQKEILKYAKSSRDITAKSYSRGGADYLDLLRAQLQYQKQLFKKVNLISKLKERKINYLFIKGESLVMRSHL
jgi:hypothetical protein